MNRVAITGIGAVTPLGLDATSTWASMVAGRSGIGPLETFDATTFPVRIAAQVKGFDPRAAIGHARDRKHLPRAAQFGLTAALEAVRQAGEGWGGPDHDDRAIAVGATVGRPELQELVNMSHLMSMTGQREFYRQAPGCVLTRNPNVGLATIARVTGCRGPAVAVSTACAGSAHAIGEAFRWVRDGDCTAALAGGFDALTTWLDVLGFALLGALTVNHNDDPTTASRPFDAGRSGFVLGEGAVMAVLEDWEVATARGASILGELVGYGSSLNAYRITDSPPDGSGAIEAMLAALSDAGADPTDVDYIVAHGTGTAGNDVSETAAIRAVFGAHANRVAVSSPKSMTGHLTSAAAGVNLVAALGALRDGVVSPTTNLDHPDPRLGLDYVPNAARPLGVDTALVNAFAFGGTNAALVVRSVEAAPRPAGGAR